MVIRSPDQSAKGCEQQNLAVCLSARESVGTSVCIGSFTCMLVKPAYKCLVALVVRAPVQCSKGCEQHNLGVCLPAYLSVHLPMTVCVAVSVLCSLYLFCRPVLLDYLVAQVVRVPDPIGDTFNFSEYVGLYPASTLIPQRYKEYQAYPKNI